MSSLSLLLLSATLANFAPSHGNTTEDQVQACIQACHAYSEQPGFDLKGCVLQCQDLAKP